MSGSAVYASVGVVVIGRNEGDRLKACLRSLGDLKATTVYVDSGSSDGSVAFARSLGVHVVQLDLSKRFTAARARNAGFAALLERHPGLELVQFVDGDCILDGGWIDTAEAHLRKHSGTAAVVGRRREMHPEFSVYNWMCDIEWNTQIGEAESFGGDVLMRVRAYRDAGGYRDDLLAGEDPEFSIRIRDLGWKIERLDAEMTLHDVAMTRLRQWWQRAKRGGYAMSRVYHLHKRSPNAMFARNVARFAVVGIAVPAVILVAGLVDPRFFLLTLVYPLLIVKRAAARGLGSVDSWRYAGMITLISFPEASGLLLFAKDHLLGRGRDLIEYK